WLNNACRTLCGALLLFMTFVLFLNILARNFLGVSYIGAEALGTYSMVWLTFIGSAYIVPAHGHVSVDLVLRAVKQRFRYVVVAFIALIGMLTSGIFFYLGAKLTQFIFATGQLETTLNIPTGFLYLPVAIGMFMMF